MNSIEEEYAAARNRAAWADLSHWGKIRFSGPDAVDFLQGLTTNDLRRLKPREGLVTCLLTPKGKLLADFELYHLEDGLLALALPQAARNLTGALAKLILLSDTRMRDITNERSLFYLTGPKVILLLETLFGPCADLRPFQARAIKWQGAELFLIAHSRLSAQGMLVLSPATKSEEIQDRIQEAGEAMGLIKMRPETFNILRVEAGIPAYGVDMDEESLPVEARLEEAISYDKGCYMGQETISRIRHRGHANKILVGLKIPGHTPPQPGAPVFAGQTECGKISSAVYSPKLRSVLALATIRIEQASAGVRFALNTAPAEETAEIIALPLA